MRLRQIARGVIRRARSQPGDRGASALELAIVAPVLLITILLTVQYALYFQAKQVALAAAQEGAREARQDAATSRNWQGQASHTAWNYYRSLNTQLLGQQVTATAGYAPGGDNDVYVTVQGTMTSLLFGRKLQLTETAQGPVECFRPDTGGDSQQC